MTATTERDLLRLVQGMGRGSTTKTKRNTRDVRSRKGEFYERFAGSDGKQTYRFLVSTPGRKGDGMDIPVEAWDLDRYRRHPNVLLNHDIHSLPIGRGERVWTDRRGLWADIRFSDSSPVAREVVSLIEEGILSSTSVNFRPHDVDRRTGRVGRAELIEISMVSVPEDASVLIQRATKRSRSSEIVAIKRDIAALRRELSSQQIGQARIYGMLAEVMIDDLKRQGYR